MTIARVFPRRTNATPADDLAFTTGPGLFPPDVDEVHVSVTFSWDSPRAEWLAKQWEKVAPVLIGGPATGMRGEEFTPGRYLKRGYVITSRGCQNRCWFCEVPKREGSIRELPITEGWNVLDDNLLACSQKHVCEVIEMLRRQPGRVQFTGGLEAARLDSWSIEAIRSVHPKQLFFSYDTPDDWEPLVRAAKLCWRAGFRKTAKAVRAYVLIGWPRDTMMGAEARLKAVLDLGVIPMAMLWRDRDGKFDPAWRQFQRLWVRPAMLRAA